MILSFLSFPFCVTGPRNLCQSIFSLRIRARSVCGLMRRRRAAPCGPRPCRASRAARLDVPAHHDVEGLDGAGGPRLRDGRRSTRARAAGPAERRRDAQRLPLPDEHRAVHHRGDLAHVPRPAILREHPHIVVRDRDGPQAEAVRGALGEVVGERADVVGGRAAAGSRSGTRPGGSRDPRGTPAPRPSPAGRGAWRRRSGRRRCTGRSPPTRTTSPSWTTRSSRTCAASGELADLVEEERAAVGLLEPALAPRRGAGERALLVAEELGVDQLRGNRAAVHPPERPVAERWSARGGRGR